MFLLWKHPTSGYLFRHRWLAKTDPFHVVVEKRDMQPLQDGFVFCDDLPSWISYLSFNCLQANDGDKSLWSPHKQVPPRLRASEGWHSSKETSSLAGIFWLLVGFTGRQLNQGRHWEIIERFGIWGGLGKEQKPCQIWLFAVEIPNGGCNHEPFLGEHVCSWL